MILNIDKIGSRDCVSTNVLAHAPALQSLSLFKKVPITFVIFLKIQKDQCYIGFKKDI